MDSSLSKTIKSQVNYKDASDLSKWAVDAAAYCEQTGVITGREGGNVCTKKTATRAEVAYGRGLL